MKEPTYLICPGYIRAKDMDIHFIYPDMLMKLYCIPKDAKTILIPHDPHQRRIALSRYREISGDLKEPDQFIICEPRQDGMYPGAGTPETPLSG